jgi:hypothetical protein
MDRRLGRPPTGTVTEYSDAGARELHLPQTTFDQGAHVTYLDPSGSQLGHKESVADTARVLGRMYDAIEFRGSRQSDVELLAEYTGVPVYNGVTDEWHPTQMLADFLTTHEYSGKPYNRLSFAFLGDCRFNTGRSLLVTRALLGSDVRLVGSRDLWPSDDVVAITERLPSLRRRRTSVEPGEDGGGDAGDAGGVGDHIDLDDAAVGDGEAHQRDGLAFQGDDHAGRPVDQGGVEGRSAVGADAGLAGDGLGAPQHPGGARAAGGEVGPGHHVGVEQGDQGVEVAGPPGREEGVHHGALPGQVAFRGGDLRALDAAAGAAGQLPGRLG